MTDVRCRTRFPDCISRRTLACQMPDSSARVTRNLSCHLCLRLWSVLQLWLRDVPDWLPSRLWVPHCSCLHWSTVSLSPVVTLSSSPLFPEASPVVLALRVPPTKHGCVAIHSAVPARDLWSLSLVPWTKALGSCRLLPSKWLTPLRLISSLLCLCSLHLWSLGLCPRRCPVRLIPWRRGLVVSGWSGRRWRIQPCPDDTRVRGFCFCVRRVDGLGLSASHLLRQVLSQCLCLWPTSDYIR